ncbi:DeoR family transcriptional regulator [Alteromonas sp.]|uniref:DeoR/GlpR family DNA-binding transcription regulator n=1 Tax=Alteromonas sp. TaxID=232 RepID=UPI000B760AD8|nr:DeoR family transcriptional regulator [Alteromonas sp.]MAI38772.1 XRE family transcriptional regulator [Alteromonas sp.]OUX85294.1 MAG: XRE family transcriptional regulator [Alteromonas sp. TMED35]
MKSSHSVDERRKRIVEWVNDNGHTRVETLASQFNASEVTIRKDLTALAAQGALIRQFGGAVPAASSRTANNNSAEMSSVTSTTSLPSTSFKTEASSLASSELSNAIGQCAANLVTPGSKLVIDCGSTTSAILPFLSTVDDLVVMTNTLSTANYLTQCDTEPTVLMAGGTWDALSQSFQGSMAEQLVSAYSFDIAFIGAAGIDVERGTTTFNELTGVTRAMANAASKVVVMASAKKLLHKMPNLELGWNKISVLITDDTISDSDKTNIENKGVTVIVATLNGE